ncbi:MAG: SDR family oxidoreductase [Acidobacteria bacterium]|nr:SDR family oxidoreductase [Acidobacteriota bacterium]
MFSLAGKKALVTGAGSANGIGFATARALRELGAEIVITSTTNRIHERAKEIGATGFVADLTKEMEVKALVQEVSNLDILVNNAGMTSVSSPAQSSESNDVATMSLDDWHRGMSRNMDTTFLVTKYLLPHLRRSKSGRIIMISSVTGHVMAMKHQPIYAAAKAAMVGLTKSIALDEAKYGITCNAVLPGWIATEAISESEKSNGASVPLGRGGTPDEVASLVAYLASTEASYITGQAIVIDGGNSIREER